MVIYLLLVLPCLLTPPTPKQIYILLLLPSCPVLQILSMPLTCMHFNKSKFTCILITELTKEDKVALIYGNNIRSLFLADNAQVSQKTKHIDIQHHFLQELAEQKEVFTKFCRSEANSADVTTNKMALQFLPTVIHQFVGSTQSTGGRMSKGGKKLLKTSNRIDMMSNSH